jgi:hypothetical protein
MDTIEKRQKYKHNMICLWYEVHSICCTMPLNLLYQCFFSSNIKIFWGYVILKEHAIFIFVFFHRNRNVVVPYKKQIFKSSKWKYM